MEKKLSRLLIAGTGGDSGKTMFSLGLLSAWRDDGFEPGAFKKGPDFIDAAWLGWAAGRPGRNLDTFMMGPEAVVESFTRHATGTGLNVIEGNRGLLDGVDASGTHSSASLAALLDCPVVLVVTPRKVTATTAATVLGCRMLAPEINLAGVVLNRVAGSRHERIVRSAIEEHAGVPVLGALPKLDGELLVSRHLGLVPPAEAAPGEKLRQLLAGVVRENCDLDHLRRIAAAAKVFDVGDGKHADGETESRPEVTIGFFRDSAFTFYYPENLEALEAAGARLQPISAVAATELPPVDALYIGGGFPETHARSLAENTQLHAAVRAAAAEGLPIYAECGGLIFLADALETDEGTVPMAGVLPITVAMHAKPQGHGYCRLEVDEDNPILPRGTDLVGHEFHYSAICGSGADLKTAYAVKKGRGCFEGRDGIVHGKVLASYVHLHALGTPAWAPGLVKAATQFRSVRRGKDVGKAKGSTGASE